MSVVVLPCAGCGSITVQCQTRSASLSKCGFPELGTPSSPPKIYRTVAQSGTTTNSNSDLCTLASVTFTNAWSGGATYDRGTCSLTETRSLTISVSGGGCTSTLSVVGGDACAYALNGSFGGYAMENVLEGTAQSCPANCPGVGCASGVGTAVIGSTTSITVTASVPGTTGSVSVSLSNEYTTSDLETDASIALNSAPWGSSGSCAGVTADVIIASNETSIALSAVLYSLSFPAALPGMSYFYDLYYGGGFISTGSVSLSAGQTSATQELDPQIFGFTNISLYLTNFRIACSA